MGSKLVYGGFMLAFIVLFIIVLLNLDGKVLWFGTDRTGLITLAAALGGLALWMGLELKKEYK
jgi:hypothetical protein